MKKYNKSINLTVIQSGSFCLSRAASYLKRYVLDKLKLITQLLYQLKIS